MGYIVQSIVFDKDKGWDMKTAREWVKNHKEFSKPIKEEETVNTIRVRLFPPKKAEEMGFTDYRMKTLASGDVGIMLDIAYNKLEGGANENVIGYEEEDRVEELKRFNLRIERIIERQRRNYLALKEARREIPIETQDNDDMGIELRMLEDQINDNNEEIRRNNAEIQRIEQERQRRERALHPTGGGTGSSKVAVTNEEDAPNEKDRAFDENTKLFEEGDKLEKLLLNIEKKLKKRMELRKRVLLEAEKEKIIAQLQEIENKMAENFQILNGGSLANEDLQALLSKSYHSKHPSDYKDFVVDKELSGQRVQVYHNPTTQQTIVAHRGTASAPNWIENVAYAVSNDKSGKAFQHSKKIQDQAYSKYGKENITTIGHSKGALHAQEYGKEGKEVITLNKPVNITDALFTRVPKSQTDIRTQYDPVSFLRPFQRGSKVETIKSTTKNPLKEHKTSVLGRLDPRKMFGKGMMCECCGVNCNCGAVRGGSKLYEVAKPIRQPLEPADTQRRLTSFRVPYRSSPYNGVTIALTNRQDFYKSIMKIVFDDNAGIKSDFYRLYNTARGKSILNRTMGSSISEVDLPYIYNTVVSGNIEELNDVIRNWYNDVDSDISSAIEEFDEEQEEQEGAGMTGGANNIRVSTNETTYEIDLSDKERFYYTALPYVNNTHIRIYQTEDGNVSIHEFLDNLNNRDPEWDNYYQNTVIPTIISKMRTTDSRDTFEKLSVFRRNINAWADVLEQYIDFAAEREGDYPTAPPTPYESDEEEDEVQNPLQGEGMNGGVLPNAIQHTFKLAKNRWYRLDMEDRTQEVVNRERQQFFRNWGELYNSEVAEGHRTLDIPDYNSLIDYFEWVFNLQPVQYVSGSGMTGGVGEFDIELGNQVERALRDAKRRWAKSPKLFENLEYERRMFNARYGHLMRHIQVHTGMGGMDLRLFRALLNYSEWVKGLEIPDTSYTPVSRGAGKKAKKTGKSKK